jgi:hypothetical protein
MKSSPSRCRSTAAPASYLEGSRRLKRSWEVRSSAPVNVIDSRHSDIVGANGKIFGRPAYCERYPPPGP